MRCGEKIIQKVSEGGVRKIEKKLCSELLSRKSQKISEQSNKPFFNCGLPEKMEVRSEPPPVKG